MAEPWTPRPRKANGRLLAICFVGSVCEVILGVVFLVIGGTEPGIFFLVIAAIQFVMVWGAILARRQRTVLDEPT